MGTRGLVGTRSNLLFLQARYHHFDSYYDYLGKEVIDIYFDEKKENVISAVVMGITGSKINTKIIGFRILELSGEEQDSRDFLKDGLFCEYAYIYNQENDTLEIYRGFFKKKQAFNTKNKILNALEEKGKEMDFCHLIMIIDRKKHTKEQVLKAFEEFNKTEVDGDGGNSRFYYPEHKIIPLEIPKDYVLLV